MRTLVAGFLFVSFSACATAVLAAGPPFAVEHVDETTTALIPGRLVRTPSGGLLATGGILPGAPSHYVSGTPFGGFIRERSGSGWIARPSPPIDLAFEHDVAIDGAGRMHTLSWQNPCSDYSRPVLQDEGPSGWSVTVLDTGATTGLAIEIDAQGQVWATYLRAHRFNCCWGPPFDLVVAHRGSSGWERDSLVVPSSTPFTPYPFAVDGSGRPHVLYAGANGQGLWHAVRDGSGWQATVVDTAVVHGTPRLAVAWDGTPHVLWAVGSTLRHARLEGTSWVPSSLPVPLAGTAYDLALAQNGSPRASYVGGSQKLVFAQDLGAGWTTAEIGNFTYAWGSNDVTLILDSSDRPTICFREGGSNWVGIASTPGATGVSPGSGGSTFMLALVSSNPSRGDGPVAWSVQLPEAGNVTLEAFDVFGRRLATSAPQACSQGESLLEWDPAPLRTGTYFVRARVNDARSSAVRWHRER